MSALKQRLAKPTIMTFEGIVTVARHNPDHDALVEGVVERLYLLQMHTPSFLYLNPLTQVDCGLGTSEFFAKARKAQAEWCQRASSLFARRNRRSVKQWTAPQGELSREARYWQRAACWLGLLFIDDRYVPPSHWPDQKPKRRNKPNQPSLPQVVEKLLLLTQPGYWSR
jgi:hypothetical protein